MIGSILCFMWWQSMKSSSKCTRYKHFNCLNFFICYASLPFMIFINFQLKYIFLVQFFQFLGVIVLQGLLSRFIPFFMIFSKIWFLTTLSCKGDVNTGTIMGNLLLIKSWSREYPPSTGVFWYSRNKIFEYVWFSEVLSLAIPQPFFPVTFD